jgi:hypothetical protein
MDMLIQQKLMDAMEEMRHVSRFSKPLLGNPRDAVFVSAPDKTYFGDSIFHFLSFYQPVMLFHSHLQYVQYFQILDHKLMSIDNNEHKKITLILWICLFSKN